MLARHTLKHCPSPFPQLLVNLSMEASLLPMLELYKVPNYVHGGNVPGSHYERVCPSFGDDLEKVPEHLSDARQTVQAAKAAVAAGKPTPLKSFG